VLTIRDTGVWQPVTARADRGHGLRLMRLLMDEVDIAAGEEGTQVELRLAITGGPRRTAPASPAPPPDATLAFRREDGVPVARLEGEVDLARVPELRAELVAAVEAGDRGLVVDLIGVGYVDSAGLHLLHDLARTLAARGQGLRVVAAPEGPVRRVLELIGLARTVPLEPTVAAAAAALEPPGAP
jgi:stage II sporulation protein AA (anti-sigma F factor antagonist)